VKIRALAAPVIAAALLLGTAGCGVFVPTATMKQYSAGDGLNVNVGKLELRNVMVITDESGDASLVGTIVNDSTNVQYVTAQFRTTTPIDVKFVAPEGITKIGLADDNPVIVHGTALKAGQYVEIYFQYGGEDGVGISIPVWDGTNPVYAPYAPSLYTPAPTPAPTAVPTPTETPAN